MLAALAAAPLAGTLRSLELHCGGAFQPELHHLSGLGASLTSLRVYGNRTMDDAALAELPRVAPALAELHLSEQQSRRGRHVQGEGLAALGALVALRSLALQCREPEPRGMAAALATLTQLTELDLSRCEPRLVVALAPLAALVHGGGALRRLSLPTAYTAWQLERGVPEFLGGGGGGGGGQGATALQALRLQTSAALPMAVMTAMTCLAGLRELNLSYCGPAGSSAAMAGVAAALTGLTSVRLVQEYDDGSGAGCFVADGGGNESVSDPRRVQDPGVAADSSACPRPKDAASTWYEALLTWPLLRQVELSYAEGLDDSHLEGMGRSLRALSCFSLSRNARATGAGFASWRAGCPGLTSLTLYECARVGDAALSQVAVLPLRTLTLAHLPEVGAVGVRHLARACTTLRSLTVERLAGVPGAALAALWRLPLLDTLCVRMCAVNNQTLEIALQESPPQDQQDLPHLPAELKGAAAAAEDADVPQVAAGPSAATTPRPPAPHLTWLELQGALVSTSGLWALRHTPGLTHLDLSYCASVGDGVADVLLLHGGSGVTAGGAGTALIPSLVHIDLRGCPLSEPTLERLRAAGLAVNQGEGTWR